jgi:hypothetical protein
VPDTLASSICFCYQPPPSVGGGSSRGPGAALEGEEPREEGANIHGVHTLAWPSSWDPTVAL